MLYRDFYDNGYHIFGLNGVTPDGTCECLNPKCTALYKHPRASNWQSTPLWSEEQLETMELLNHFESGYGVLCDGLMVLDVDERNGGSDSFKMLLAAIPEISDAGLIVRTGSGGSSRHLFFKHDKTIKLNQHLKEYAGIDFKSSGFVVGAGSMHKSGNRYEVISGEVDEIGEIPQRLLELLQVRDKHTSTHNNQDIEVSDNDIIDMLFYIDPDCEYNTWIRIGMSIHDTTRGSGFDLWNRWSSKGKKYKNIDELQKSWLSFGKSSNPTTIGTLIYYAQQNGYKFSEDITFESDIIFDYEVVEQQQKKTPPLKKYTFDPLNPPKLVGRIARWINSRSMYPRENLAVAAALTIVSSAGGMRFRGEDDTTGNLFAFCVAGSGTGKESILQSFIMLMRKVGIVQSVHGSIKSEQEIFRNIIDHQSSIYTVDEIGEMLAKIQGARNKSGSSSYLEGIVGTLMSIYSKTNGIQLITGDAKKALKTTLINELNALRKKVDENESNDAVERRIAQLTKNIEDADSGIVNPFVSLLGFTAPNRFSTLLDQDMADNGFFARALIFREMDDNPYFKENYKSPPSENEDKELQQLAIILGNMYYRGYTFSGRVELMGNTENIPMSAKAKELLHQIRHDFWEMGEQQKEREGFVAYTRRGAEMTSRIALILSMGEVEIDEECILWAYEMVKFDMKQKILLTNSNNTQNKESAVISKILSHISSEGTSLAVIKNKCQSVKSDIVDKAIKYLQDNHKIISREHQPVRGKKSIRYFLID